MGHLHGNINNLLTKCCGPGSSVGTATDYGLDDPGSNPVGDEIYIRGVTGGTDQTSGGRFLCYTIPI